MNQNKADKDLTIGVRDCKKAWGILKKTKKTALLERFLECMREVC